jgi:hypothetical protein
MKKQIFLFVYLFFLVALIFAEKYELGEIVTDDKNAAVFFDNTNGEVIEVYVPKMVNPVVLYPIADLAAQLTKFTQWYKTALAEKYVLNKDIGKLKTFETKFITSDTKYFMLFMENRTGSKVIKLDLTNVNKFLELIDKKYIDKVIADEKAKQEQEDKLFN